MQRSQNFFGENGRNPHAGRKLKRFIGEGRQVASGGPTFSEDWQHQREAQLLDCFHKIDGLTKAGTKPPRAAKNVAPEFKPIEYRNADGRKRVVTLSHKTLLRKFYQWKRDGEAALKLRYRIPPKAVPVRLQGEFMGRFKTLQYDSIGGVYGSLLDDWKAGNFLRGFGSWRTWVHGLGITGVRKAPRFPIGRWNFRRLFKPAERKMIRRFFRDRRRVPVLRAKLLARIEALDEAAAREEKRFKKWLAITFPA